MGRHSVALQAIVNTECANTDNLMAASAEALRQHPDYRIITSFPGQVGGSLSPRRYPAEVFQPVARHRGGRPVERGELVGGQRDRRRCPVIRAITSSPYPRPWGRKF